MTTRDETVAPVRGEAVRVLTALSEATKAQQAFLNSCSDATWIAADDRSAIRWLLAALIDHRRRVRVAIRLWRTLNTGEPASRELVAETADLLDENSHFTPFISQWRAVVLGQSRMERDSFWRKNDRARRAEHCGLVRGRGAVRAVGALRVIRRRRDAGPGFAQPLSPPSPLVTGLNWAARAEARARGKGATGLAAAQRV